MPNYDYDVFISYSSADAEWALKLESDLQATGVNVFLDRKRLIAGAPWEAQLIEKLRNSQHLIVLWSKNAAESDWVRRERGQFEAVIYSDATGQAARDRLMIFVTLEEQSLAYASLQLINDLKIAQAYGGGVKNLDPQVWQNVIVKIVSAIQSQDSSTPVLVAMLVATAQEIANLSAVALNTIVNDLSIGTSQELIDRYGAKRTDWKPFGCPRSILNILEDQRLNIHKVTVTQKFRWELIGDDFWTSADAARRHADTLRERLSLIIIDPVSLNVPLVYQKANVLKKCLANNNTAVMVPTPFSMTQPSRKLRALIRDAGAPFFDEYYEPPVREVGPVALFGMNIGDEDDTRRLLLAALGPYVRQTQLQSGSPYTRQ